MAFGFLSSYYQCGQTCSVSWNHSLKIKVFPLFCLGSSWRLSVCLALLWTRTDLRQSGPRLSIDLLGMRSGWVVHSRYGQGNHRASHKLWFQGWRSESSESRSWWSLANQQCALSSQIFSILVSKKDNVLWDFEFCFLQLNCLVYSTLLCSWSVEYPSFFFPKCLRRGSDRVLRNLRNQCLNVIHRRNALTTPLSCSPRRRFQCTQIQAFRKNC